MSAMEHIPATSGASRVEDLKDEVAVAKKIADENKATMETLLSDVYSVETRLVFTQDKSSFSDFGLWAHRSILSRYHVFGELIKQATQKRSEKDIDLAPLTLAVDEISFPTFCSLLMFIYTGEIERNINPTRFAISKLDRPPKYSISGDSTRDEPCWRPLDSGDSPWNFKPVQWDDLLFAADLYKIEELRAICQKYVIEAIENTKAVETLIHVGTRFPEVKEAAINYIARNMDTMFADGNDPFAPFLQHPKCHELLVEVMLRSRVMRL
ncbi:hypothetical protein BGZ74_010966 [Mortierella antarctica]|nr:hypothetical protein BGZ74_010966 [Mortierella antarctica]